MPTATGKWTLGLVLSLVGLVVLALLAGSAFAAPLGFSASAAVAAADSPPVFQAILLGAAGLMAIALLEQAERWR